MNVPMKVWVIPGDDPGEVDFVTVEPPVWPRRQPIESVLLGLEGKVLVDRKSLRLALIRQVTGHRAVGEVVERCSWPGCEFGVAVTTFGAEGKRISYHPAHSGTCPLREPTA